LSWHDLQPSGISASSAPGLLKRLASGRMILLWNQRLPEGATSYPLRGGDGLWSEVPVSNHRDELSLAWYDETTHTISPPVIIARQSASNISYPRLLERRPGELWLSQLWLGSSPRLCLRLLEQDFV
jgi:sialidase-1